MPKVYPHNHKKLSINLLIKKILSFIFPPRCVRCGVFNTFLCEDCLPQLARNNEVTETGIMAAFNYHDPVVKKAIRYLKYHGIKDLAEPLAREMYSTFLTTTFDELMFNRGLGKIVVIPVPLHKKRQRKRGFNQAEELAKLFCTFDPKNFEVRTNLVFKIKNTLPQVKQKKRAERLKNLKGAFVVGYKKRIAGKTIVVIDDVATTGATIGEVKKVLQKAGARKVFAIVAAQG